MDGVEMLLGDVAGLVSTLLGGLRLRLTRPTELARAARRNGGILPGELHAMVFGLDEGLDDLPPPLVVTYRDRDAAPVSSSAAQDTTGQDWGRIAYAVRDGATSAINGVALELWDTPFRLRDMGVALAAVTVNQFRAEGDYWLPEMVSLTARDYASSGQTWSEFALDRTPVGLGKALGNAAGAAVVDGNYEPLANLGGAMIAGGLLGKATIRYGNYGVTLESINASGLGRYQAGSIGVRFGEVVANNSASRPGGYVTNDVDAHGLLSPQVNRTSGYTNTRADRYVQSHHPIQDKWAQENIPGYDRDAAPAILLESASGSAHAKISAAQRALRSQMKNSGVSPWSNGISQEFQVGHKQMIDAGVPEGIARKAIKDSYKYFDSLGAFK